MTLEINWEGSKQKYTYRKRLTNQSWKVGVDYVNQDLNYPPVVAVSCENRKVMREKNCTKGGLKNKKVDNIEFRKKTKTKLKSNLKWIESYNICSY